MNKLLTGLVYDKLSFKVGVLSFYGVFMYVINV